MDGNYTIFSTIADIVKSCPGPFIMALILGPVINVCVICLILAGPRKKAMDIAYLNQTLCELAINVFDATWLISRNISRNISEHDVLGGFYFRYMAQFSLGLLFSGRPMFMSWVCLERYLAVVHPVTFLKYINSTYRAAAALVVWLLVLACSMSIMGMSYPAVYYLCLGMCSPWFLLQLFFSVEILRALVRPGPGDGGERKAMNSAKLSAFRVVMIILVAEVVAYATTAASTILFSLNHLKWSTDVYCIANYFMVITAVIPPLIFINTARKYCCKNTT